MSLETAPTARRIHPVHPVLRRLGRSLQRKAPVYAAIFLVSSVIVDIATAAIAVVDSAPHGLFDLIFYGLLLSITAVPLALQLLKWTTDLYAALVEW